MKSKFNPNLQGGLFKYNIKQLCKEAHCKIGQLRKLQKEGFLSFSLDKKVYEEYEITEARFLTSLLNSGISAKKIKFMLSKLEKPFAYTNLSYDFVKKAWVEKSIGPDEDISVVEDYIDDYIEYLVEEGDGEKIKEIFNLLKEKVEV